MNIEMPLNICNPPFKVQSSQNERDFYNLLLGRWNIPLLFNITFSDKVSKISNHFVSAQIMPSRYPIYRKINKIVAMAIYCPRDAGGKPHNSVLLERPLNRHQNQIFTQVKILCLFRINYKRDRRRHGENRYFIGR